MSDSLFEIPIKTIDGQETSLAPFKGNVLLIVNVASQCGFTPQYEGLEALHEKYGSRGFAVLGFPCNQFGGQEPGDEQQIQSFCKTSFGVQFPMFAKIDVNGPHAHPLYAYLKSHKKGLLGTEAVKWNFTKFLVARDGTVLDRFSPQTKPESIKKDIEEALSVAG